IMLFLLLIPVVVVVLVVIVSPRPSKLKLAGAHVMITGGSSGIGLEIAKECARQGGFVTLVARNAEKLAQAKAEVEPHLKNGGEHQCVMILPMDVSESYDKVERGIRKVEEKLGPVDVLVNCAGVSHAQVFEDTPAEKFEWLMKINLLGSIYCSKAVVGGMKLRKKGRIAFVSSQAGQTGVFGYTGYAATKYALRGLAETLQMEIKPFNMAVTISFPPDTDTPGFHSEDNTKPEETRLISETAGLFSADVVARSLVRDIVKGEFLHTVGLDGFILGNLTVGMAPCNSIVSALLQVLLMSPLRIVALAYLKSFDIIVAKCARKNVDKMGKKLS
uniref:3-dehydrosphinganine reductase n=1 Tax=Ciona savignyi TaxID=51511 RepID=H2YIA8_CIOSA